MGAGLQQGLDYSTTLGIPFVFTSNGDGFVFHDKTFKEGWRQGRRRGSTILSTNWSQS